jgi:hypothetical protein
MMPSSEVGAMESISWPRRHSYFPAWLVPARNNIQRELLRIQDLLAAVAHTPDAVQGGVDEDMLNLMLGAAFSLWRTVIQADHQYDQETTAGAVREFADEVLRNDVAIQTTELNAWLLGYYLSDGRLRLIRVVKLWGAENLKAEVFQGYRLIEIDPSRPTFTPKGWGQCFAVLHDLLASFERRIERTRTQAQTQSETGPTDRERRGPPIVVGSYGTYAILQCDGSAASFLDGKWQPGIAWDARDFLEMSVVSNAELVSILLNTASEALAKSLER